MGDLHGESSEQRFPYVFVQLCFELRIGEVGQNGDAVAFHDPVELHADVIGLHEVAFREVVVPGPLAILDICVKQSYWGCDVSVDGGRGYFADICCMR